MVPVAHQGLVFFSELPDIAFQFGDFGIQFGERRLFHRVVQLLLRPGRKVEFARDGVDPQTQTVVCPVQGVDDILCFGLFGCCKFLLLSQLFQPFQLCEVCLLQRIVPCFDDGLRLGELLLCFCQSDNPAVGGIHRESQIAVFCLELVDQRVRLGNSGSVQFGQCGERLKPGRLVRILCSGDLDPDFPETGRDRVQANDFPRCPVHRHTEISVFSGEIPDQRFRFVLPVDVQFHFQRKRLQFAEFGEIAGVLDLQLDRRNPGCFCVQRGQSDGCFVHGDPQVSVFGGELSDQPFRFGLSFGCENDFGRECLQPVELLQVGLILDPELDILDLSGDSVHPHDFARGPVHGDSEVSVTL